MKGAGFAHIKGQCFMCLLATAFTQTISRDKWQAAQRSPPSHFTVSLGPHCCQCMAVNFRFLPHVKKALEAFSFGLQTRVMSSDNVVHCISTFYKLGEPSSDSSHVK